MRIDPNISIDEFCAEMQHRVVRYPLRSIAVRTAVRFAKKHKNPEYYRIAANKVHAQRQFHREEFGPSRLEKFFDYFSFGSLREVVVTLILVAIGVVGIDAGRRALGRAEKTVPYEHMDVDQLAKKLGILLEDSGGTQNSTHSDRKLSSLIPLEMTQEPKPRISDQDIHRIVEAVLIAMKERESTNVKQPEPAVSQEIPVTKTEAESLVAAEQERSNGP